MIFHSPFILFFLQPVQVFSSSSTVLMWNGGLWSRTSSLMQNSWLSSSSLLLESCIWWPVSEKKVKNSSKKEEPRALSSNVSFYRGSKELWESIWGLRHRLKIHSVGPLLCSVLLLWLGYTQLCHRGDPEPWQVITLCTHKLWWLLQNFL